MIKYEPGIDKNWLDQRIESYSKKTKMKFTPGTFAINVYLIECILFCSVYLVAFSFIYPLEFFVIQEC